MTARTLTKYLGAVCESERTTWSGTSVLVKIGAWQALIPMSELREALEVLEAALSSDL